MHGFGGCEPLSLRANFDRIHYFVALECVALRARRELTYSTRFQIQTRLAEVAGVLVGTWRSTTQALPWYYPGTALRSGVCWQVHGDFRQGPSRSKSGDKGKDGVGPKAVDLCLSFRLLLSPGCPSPRLASRREGTSIPVCGCVHVT